MENFRYLPGVTTLRLDEAACVGCGMCEIVCPHGVFSLHSHKARIDDLDGCMECGACARNCPTEAIASVPLKRSLSARESDALPILFRPGLKARESTS